MEQTAYSETSAYKIQTPANYPEEIQQHSKHGERLKSISDFFENETLLGKSYVMNMCVCV